jgi:hypothetical protein
MALGLIDRSVLYDIANAIREQNGTGSTYLPSAMADAVEALDGSSEGSATTADLLTGTGVINDAVFSAIADAIRAQNGLSTTYKPGEMAQAIRDLTWTKYVPRAVYDGDGLLEINYYSSPHTSGYFKTTYEQYWEIDPTGYSKASEVPWYSMRDEISSVYIDDSMLDVEIPNISYWFFSMQNLVDVSGFDYLTGVTQCDQLFSGCGQLRSVFTMEGDFDQSGITSATYPFNGCYNLVGGHLTVPTNTSSYTLLTNASGGVLTDTSTDDGDERVWVDGTYYDDGSVYVHGYNSAEGVSEVASGKVCANAHYRSSSALPWADYKSSITSIHFGASLDKVSGLVMDYWFYNLKATAVTFEGWQYVHPSSMSYLLNGSLNMTVLDLTGLDASGCAYWNYAFSAMSALTTIYVDSDWALPSTFSSKSNTFYNDKNLVGGNGTAYSSSKTSADYAVIDTDETPGYLTAASS